MTMQNNFKSKAQASLTVVAPGHFQVSKVVRQVISCEGPKVPRTRPVSWGSETTLSRPNYCTCCK